MTELERIDKLVRVIAENNQQITALKKENDELRARLNERSGVSQNEQPAASGEHPISYYVELQKAANQAAETRRRDEQD